jgi:hypothetical protein
MYTAPDPEHRTSVTMPGPQTYAYAGGNPLRYSDATGRSPSDIPVNEFMLDVAASKGAENILAKIVTEGANREYGCWILGEYCGDNVEEYKVDAVITGDEATLNASRPIMYGRKLAFIHNHPSGFIRPSVRDQEMARQPSNSLYSIYIMGEGNVVPAASGEALVLRFDFHGYNTINSSFGVSYP